MLNLFRKGQNSWYYRKEEARESELEFTTWLYQQWWQNLQPGACLNDPSSPKQQRRPPLSCLTQNIVRKSTWNDRHTNPPYITPLYMHSPRCLVLNEHSHSSCPELRYSTLGWFLFIYKDQMQNFPFLEVPDCLAILVYV